MWCSKGEAVAVWRLRRGIIKAAALLVLMLTSTARGALNCDVDSSGFPVPDKNDTLRLAEILVGTATGCSNQTCDFDGDGQGPSLSDLTKLVTGLENPGAIACPVPGPELTFSGYLGYAGRQASTVLGSGAKILVYREGGGVMDAGTVSNRLDVVFSVPSGGRYLAVIRPEQGQDIPLRFPLKNGSTPVLPLDGEVRDELAEDGEFSFGEMSLEGGELVPLRNPLSVLAAGPGVLPFSETRDAGALAALSASERVLMQTAWAASPELPDVQLDEAGGTVSGRVATVEGRVTRYSGSSIKIEVNGRGQVVNLLPGERFTAQIILTSGENYVRACVGVECDQGIWTTTFKPTNLWVQLSWLQDKTDVDLYVTDPKGNTSFFANKKLPSGGFLDVDDTNGFGPEAFFLSAAAGHKIELGEYVVRVHYYANHGNNVPIQFKVTVLVNETERYEYNGLISAASSSSYGPGGWAKDPNNWADAAIVDLNLAVFGLPQTVDLTASKLVLNVGDESALTLNCEFPDGIKLDCTQGAAWLVSPQGLGIVDSSGVFRGLATGDLQIRGRREGLDSNLIGLRIKENQRPSFSGFSCTPETGVVPLQVTCGVTGAVDPDGDQLLCDYFWGDERVSAGFRDLGKSCESMTHTYSHPGTYEAYGIPFDGSAYPSETFTTAIQVDASAAE